MTGIHGQRLLIGDDVDDEAELSAAHLKLRRFFSPRNDVKLRRAGVQTRDGTNLCAR